MKRARLSHELSLVFSPSDVLPLATSEMAGWALESAGEAPGEVASPEASVLARTLGLVRKCKRLNVRKVPPLT